MISNVSHEMEEKDWQSSYKSSVFFWTVIFNHEKCHWEFFNYKKWYTAYAEHFTSFKIREAIGKTLLKEE